MVLPLDVVICSRRGEVKCFSGKLQENQIQKTLSTFSQGDDSIVTSNPEMLQAPRFMDFNIFIRLGILPFKWSPKTQKPAGSCWCLLLHIPVVLLCQCGCTASLALSLSSHSSAPLLCAKALRTAPTHFHLVLPQVFYICWNYLCLQVPDFCRMLLNAKCCSRSPPGSTIDGPLMLTPPSHPENIVASAFTGHMRLRLCSSESFGWRTKHLEGMKSHTILKKLGWKHFVNEIYNC